MKNLISAHLSSAKNAACQLIKQPFGSLLTLCMLAIAMTLPLSLYLGMKSSEPLMGKLTQAPQLTVFLEMGADEIDVAAIKGELKARSDLEQITFVPKDQALKDLQTKMGQDDLMTLLEENPLPDAFILTPKNFSPEVLEKMKQDLSQLPMVQMVQIDTQWAETLFNIMTVLEKLTLFLAVTLSLAFVLVSHNTIRLQILAHKDEIEITKLLGAPASFIRRPFLYQAAHQGILSCALSLLICVWIAQRAEPLLNNIFSQYNMALTWRFFDSLELVFIFLIIIVLATLGAFLATSQHLAVLKARK